uniref:Uncharacterized protein n=1 Tax=Meloidogyne enterolobii TaxID=390850 RepID=A0A6V7UHJ0_MELEN|nr:unnamed protein product [Meloidogyne enterolobii]
MLALAEKANTETKITEEIEAQLIDAHLVAKIPEEFKKYFASISGFNEEIELSREQFYDSELIRLDLMGKSSKSSHLTKVLSSSAKILRLNSSKSLKSSSNRPSAIEEYITKHKNPALKVGIYMVQCGYSDHDKTDPFAKDVVYKINTDSYYHCKSCKDRHVDGVKEYNVYTSLTKETFKLPSLKRTIQNPILQNGNGLGFTYIFDFAQQKQDMSINLNFVQLVVPNNLHNESTSSSHVPEYGYETPEHPTNVSTNFQNLNLRDDEDGSESETERPNYAAMAGGQGTRLNFDEASSSSGSSVKRSSRRPPSL